MHLTGVFGIIFYLFVLYHQAILSGQKTNSFFRSTFSNDRSNYLITDSAYSIDISYTSQLLFYVFTMCLLYCTTFLPSGRYYQRVYGNNGLLFSFFYIFFYLIFFNAKKPNFLYYTHRLNVYTTNRVNFFH